MKKVTFYTTVIALSVMSIAGGCSKKDVIELLPAYSLDAIQNPSSLDQVEQVLLGAYSGFRSQSYYGSGNPAGPFSILNDMMSDNVIETRENLPQDRVMTDWLYNSDAAQIENMMRQGYVIINRANIVLRDIDKFATPANQKQVNRYKGQALAIRAHVHFDLFRYFAPSFDRTSTTSPALPYVKDPRIANNITFSRLKNKEFYDQIFADLSQAATLLADLDRPVNQGGVTRPFIDVLVVRAMQARINLYAGQWADAISAASTVIAARPLVANDAAAFRGMYNETDLGEIIWNIQFDAGQGGPGGPLFFPAGNRNSFRPADEIGTTTGTTGLIRNTDIRYPAYFATVNSPSGTARLVVSKYNGKGSLTDANANFPVFRTGEMYLIRAEARARSGQEALALDDLNSLRRNRITGFVDLTGVTGAALLQEIANERRAELFGEGHRWFDLKRTTRTINRTSGCGTATSPATRCTLAPNAREWWLPIPFAEIQTNPSMEQNPQY